MIEASELIQVIHDMVLAPSFYGGVAVLTTTLLNEILALIPYHILLSGQLLFLEGPLSVELFRNLLLFVAVPVGLGTTIGSLVTYTLAYLGGKPAIERLGKYIKLSWTSVENVKNRLAGNWYDEVVFFALRAIPLLPSLPINVAAGLIRMRPITYIFLTLVGTIIKIMILFILVAIGVVGITQ